MPCEFNKELLDAFVDGETTPDEEKAVREHLESCEECRKEVEMLRKVVANVKEVAFRQVSARVIAGIRTAIAGETVKAKGGFGTIYKMLAAAAAVIIVSTIAMKSFKHVEDEEYDRLSRIQAPSLREPVTSNAKAGAAEYRDKEILAVEKKDSVNELHAGGTLELKEEEASKGIPEEGSRKLVGVKPQAGVFGGEPPAPAGRRVNDIGAGNGQNLPVETASKSGLDKGLATERALPAVTATAPPAPAATAPAPMHAMVFDAQNAAKPESAAGSDMEQPSVGGRIRNTQPSSAMYEGKQQMGGGGLVAESLKGDEVQREGVFEQASADGETQEIAKRDDVRLPEIYVDQYVVVKAANVEEAKKLLDIRTKETGGNFVSGAFVFTGAEFDRYIKAKNELPPNMESITVLVKITPEKLKKAESKEAGAITAPAANTVSAAKTAQHGTGERYILIQVIYPAPERK